MRTEQNLFGDFLPVSNYERITGMTIEELAKWMMDHCGCFGCAYMPGECRAWCIDGHIAWLKQVHEKEI